MALKDLPKKIRLSGDTDILLQLTIETAENKSNEIRGGSVLDKNAVEDCVSLIFRVEGVIYNRSYAGAETYQALPNGMVAVRRHLD